jgi:hypothetical protein
MNMGYGKAEKHSELAVFLPFGRIHGVGDCLSLSITLTHFADRSTAMQFRLWK